ERDRAFVFLDVMHRHDVRVRERRGRARLAQESLAQPGVAGKLRLQHLERDKPVETQVRSEVDRAHAATTEFALDAVPLLEALRERERHWATPKLRRTAEFGAHRLVEQRASRSTADTSDTTKE